MSGSGDLLELLLNPLHEEPSPARILVEVATEYWANIELTLSLLTRLPGSCSPSPCRGQATPSASPPWRPLAASSWSWVSPLSQVMVMDTEQL